MTQSNQEILTAYATHQNSQEDNREIDKRILLAAAGKLKVALDSKGEDMELYREAIKFNQRVWTLFQVALCEPDNALPDDLKMNLLNLSRYIDRTSFRAVTQFAPQLINSLIDINRSIAAGLAKKPTSERQSPVTIEQSVASASVMISA